MSDVQGFGCFVFCPSRKAWSCICYSTERERCEAVAEELRDAVEALAVRVVEVSILPDDLVSPVEVPQAPQVTDLFPDIWIE